MRGAAKKKSSSEAPIDVAVTAADIVNASDGGSGSLAPFGENDQTQLQKGEGEETHLQDLEGEAADGEEVAGEEEKEDQDIVPEEGQCPKLDDGFYEIEAVRRRRVRKGQLRYLIKWRGWPETANTWEPLENLQSIPDVIDAFEESLRSGKHRKRKRKHVVHHTQLKKRQQRSTTSYSLRDFASTVADNHQQSAPLNELALADTPALTHIVVFADERENYGDASSLGNAKQANENVFVNVSKQIVERNEENDYDPRLSELKATTNNGVDVDKLAIHFQEAKASTGNGQSKVDCVEPVQSGCSRGAKRRKSGSVKRFKKDSYLCEPVDSQNANGKSGGTMRHAVTDITDFAGNNSPKKLVDAKIACNIVKIIKPVGYSASLSSSNIQDVLVTFMAMRSDGTEVMVDNKYLKANNPVLLINFYEQHLRYSPMS